MKLMKTTEAVGQVLCHDITLSVSLDGQELYLTPFVQRMLAGALDGMLRTLDGYHEGCEITLRMKSKT